MLRELTNRSLTSKRRLLDAGELSPRTFQDYHALCRRLIEALGRDQCVTELRPVDFEQLRLVYANTLGPVALGNAILKTKMVFKYAADQELIERPVTYGQGFRRPSRKVLRQARLAKGQRMFEADALRSIIAAASNPIRAMVLPGINCAFGQSDIANITVDAFDSDSGWINFPRPKTAVQRRCPLWAETRTALKTAIENRPQSKKADDDLQIFLTSRGERWVKTSSTGAPNDVLGKAFSRLLKQLGLKKPGISFYALRHTFETIAGESRDQVAVDHIMGHSRNDMASVYREWIGDGRLKAVTEFVREWLFDRQRTLD